MHITVYNCNPNKYAYNFQQFETIRSFAKNIFLARIFK